MADARIPPDRPAQAGLARRRLLAGLLACAAGAGYWLSGRPSGLMQALGAAAPPPPPGSPPDKGGPGGVTVKPNDPAISAGPVQFPGVIKPIQGYVAGPSGGETYPGILVVHDADGLTDHARDVARRLAKAGYVGLVPDFLSRLGGTAKVGTTSQVVAAMSQISVPQFLDDANAAIRYLGAHPLVSKLRMGLLAFGLGGRFAWIVLAQNSDLKAASICYGDTPPLAVVPHITAAVLGIYGADDGHDPDDFKAFDAAMKKAGVTWSYKVEPKAGRGFFDDTRKTYVPDAAKDAWKLTLGWYAEYLPA